MRDITATEGFFFGLIALVFVVCVLGVMNALADVVRALIIFRQEKWSIRREEHWNEYTTSYTVSAPTKQGCEELLAIMNLQDKPPMAQEIKTDSPDSPFMDCEYVPRTVKTKNYERLNDE